MIELLDPTTEAAAQSMAYAARPDTLAGKRVALIENTKFNSDKLLLEDRRAAQAGVQRRRRQAVPQAERQCPRPRGDHRGHPKSCDLVVAGIGD